MLRRGYEIQTQSCEMKRLTPTDGFNMLGFISQIWQEMLLAC